MFSKTKSVLSRDVINRLVKANFGEQSEVTSIKELTEGWFNAIYVLHFAKPVNGFEELVLKVGVQEVKHILTYEKEIMRTEVLVYQKLATTDVPVPRVICHDFSHKLIDCDYFFMEKLQGKTWEKLNDTLTPQNLEQLQYDLGRYTAMIHSIRGDYFGYIKKDKAHHFSTWREAFRSFIDNLIADGRRDKVDLPYDKILNVLEPFWDSLDAVKEPSLVNYDMWSKNILLKESNGQYVIEGIIDHERAFFGDSIAEYISTSTICGNLEKAKVFQNGYSSIRPFVFGVEEQIRYWLYTVYMGLLIGVEIYRYEESDIPKFMEMSINLINQGLDNLKKLGQ